MYSIKLKFWFPDRIYSVTETQQQPSLSVIDHPIILCPSAPHPYFDTIQDQEHRVKMIPSKVLRARHTFPYTPMIKFLGPRSNVDHGMSPAVPYRPRPMEARVALSSQLV